MESRGKHLLRKRIRKSHLQICYSDDHHRVQEEVLRQVVAEQLIVGDEEIRNHGSWGGRGEVTMEVIEVTHGDYPDTPQVPDVLERSSKRRAKIEVG